MKPIARLTLVAATVAFASPSYADEIDVDAVVGGAVGGALGAAVGSAVGGRNGAIAGGAIGAAAGVAVATEPDHHHHTRTTIVHEHEVVHAEHPGDRGRHLGHMKHKHKHKHKH